MLRSYFQLLLLLLVAVISHAIPSASAANETSSKTQVVIVASARLQNDTKHHLKTEEEKFFSIDCNSDIVFFLDIASWRIDDDSLKELRECIVNSVKTFARENTRVGLVLQNPKLILNLTSVTLFSQSINNVISGADLKLSEISSNNINASLAAAVNLFENVEPDRASVAKLLVIITDGQSTTNGSLNTTEIFTRNITTFVIGIGANFSESQLRILAGNDANRIFTIQNYHELQELKPKLKNPLECTKTELAGDETYYETDESPSEEDLIMNLIYVVMGIVVGLFVISMVVLMIRLRLQISHQQQIFLQQRVILKEEEDVFRFGQIIQNYDQYTDSELIQARPYDSKYEIPSKYIIIHKDKILGSGHFGIVYEGEVHWRDNTTNEVIQVAVKTVRPNVDVDYIRAMLSEIKVMTFIGRHSNIVNLIGACTKNIRKNEILLAVEYCSKSNLHDFLRTNRSNFKNQIKNGQLEKWEIYDEDCLYTRDLIRWSAEIAHAMAFLSDKKVIHMDLACRNILLTEKLVAKISDFGLSRQLINYSNYVKKNQSCPLPWRWLALESLKDMEFSVKSDVWSYGVLLWEIFSLAKVPFPEQVWNQDFIGALERGERLRMPEFATEYMYELMRKCWESAPSARPDFLELRVAFSGMLAKISNQQGCLDLCRRNEIGLLSCRETSAIGNNYITCV